MKKLIIICMLLLTVSLVHAQDKYEIKSDDYGNSEVEMADTFRQEGKIYVVVGVTGIILAGLFLYAIVIDRKVSRLEKMLDSTDIKSVQNL